MDDSLPGVHIGPSDESCLGVGGLLSPPVFSRLQSRLSDAICVCVAFTIHAFGAGDDSSTEYSVCCLEASVASWRVSQVTCSEIRTDSLLAPVVFPSASGDVLTSVSSCGPSASGAVPFSLPSPVLALAVAEFLVPHIQTPCVVLNMLLDFEAGLSRVGTVALIEPSSLLLVPGTIVLAVLGVCLSLPEAAGLLILVVRSVLSHSEP